MSVSIKPCRPCRREGNLSSKDGQKRKKCPRCSYIAILPPSLGRRSLGTFKTKEAAEQALEDALVDNRRGIKMDFNTITIGALVASFLRAKETRLSPSTHHRYQQLWEDHAAARLAALPIAKVSPDQIDELYARIAVTPGRRKRPLSMQSILHLHRMLFTVFAWGERKKLLTVNPMRNVDTPSAEVSQARDLTPDEAAKFLEAASGHVLYPFFALATATGARRGELAALKWDAVDFDHGTVTIRQAIGARFDRDASGIAKRTFYVKETKSKKPRTVPLSDLGTSALRLARAAQAAQRLASGAIYEDQGYVFTDTLGCHINPDHASHIFGEIARRAKLRGVTLHSLRHSAASWAIGSGMDVITVAALLGHTTPAITLKVYGHVQVGNQLRAVSVINDVLDRAKNRRAVGE